MDRDKRFWTAGLGPDWGHKGSGLAREEKRGACTGKRSQREEDKRANRLHQGRDRDRRHRKRYY